MGRAFGLVLMLISLYIGMEIYTKGMDQALGGAFAAIEPMSQREEPLATGLTPAAGLAEEPSGPTRPINVTDRVRQKVTADMAAGARRYSGDSDPD
jgi:hypothetical protein